MQIVPVLDLMQGLVVRAIAGRRREYRPIVSEIADQPEPHVILEAFHAQFGFDEIYLADLDAIAGAEPALDLYRSLGRRGARLWVDAGVRDLQRADLLADCGVGIVVGLETLAGPAALAEIVARHENRLLFSLDLNAGTPLGDRNAWNGADALDIARQAIRLGVSRLLVLDLARVGVGAGVGTEPLLAAIRAIDPRVSLWAGGGIRERAQVLHLDQIGVDAVLVASALHDGGLTPRDVLELQSSSPRELNR